MLTNKEYSQIITALYYSTQDGKTVNISAANSLLRIFTKSPGEVKFDESSKALVIASPETVLPWWKRMLGFHLLAYS